MVKVDENNNFRESQGENGVIQGVGSSNGSKEKFSDLPNPTLSLSNINPFILTFRRMEYAARGPLILRAMEIERELGEKAPEKTRDFTTVIKGNLGDAAAMNQSPITFLRQVIAMVSYPDLRELGVLQPDVIAKVDSILGECRGKSIGAYTDCRGINLIRRHCAEYIGRRDGVIPPSPEDIILTTGASEGIRAALKLFKSDGKGRGRSGVLVPVPQYPLYNATLGEYDMVEVEYYLNEERGWSIDVSELERALNDASGICTPSAIVIINPGNPTGHVLTRTNMEQIIKFAHKHRLFILSDEVYQQNVYGGAEWSSFSRVMRDLGSPYSSMELISFFSCSKGFASECGLRGGFMELCNLDPKVQSILIASLAAKLCPNILGQVAIDCIVDPPVENSPSYPTFASERDAILGSLSRKAQMVSESLNTLPKMQCSPVQGAMYAYPRVFLPERSILQAKKVNLEPDEFYCMELLEKTGVCLTPGSGIGQIPGTFHFRTTILPPEDQLREMLRKIKDFHSDFLQEFA